MTLPAQSQDDPDDARDGDDRPLRLRCSCLVVNAPDDLRVVEREAGEVGPGQVLVRVGYGGICGSDLHYVHQGGFGTVRLGRGMAPNFLPTILTNPFGDSFTISPLVRSMLWIVMKCETGGGCWLHGCTR
jgi:hypothetical protein